MITAAITFVVGLVVGFLMPRDAFPWMTRWSAWLMRNRDNRTLGHVLVLVALAILIALIAAGCGKKASELTTTRTIPGPSLPGFKGDDAYAEVQTAALGDLHQRFRAVLNQQGLVKWDARFDCNHLADLYIAVAQARYAATAWHSNTAPQAMALAVVWYRRDAGGSHAVVEARTEQGALFVDPGAGPEPVKLSANEERTIYFRKW